VDGKGREILSRSHKLLKQSFRKAKIIIDDKIVSSTATTERSQSLDTTPQSIEFLFSWPSISNASSKSALVSLSGQCSLSAVVPPKCLLAEAAESLQTDAIRTIISRITILAEALEDAEQQKESEASAPVNTISSQRLPYRYEFTLPKTSLPGFVYLLPDEISDNVSGVVIFLKGSLYFSPPLSGLNISQGEDSFDVT